MYFRIFISSNQVYNNILCISNFKKHSSKAHVEVWILKFRDYIKKPINKPGQNSHILIFNITFLLFYINLV